MTPQIAPLPKSNRSTGPRTEPGKAASSQNALRHGLASGTLLMPGEDPAEWHALLKGLLDEWAPASATERVLVENMARHQWLLERAIRLQAEALAASTGPGILPPSFALLLRYQVTNERAFLRAYQALEELQQARREFVSQKQQDDVFSRLTAPLPASNYTGVLEKLAALRSQKPESATAKPGSLTDKHETPVTAEKVAPPPAQVQSA